MTQNSLSLRDNRSFAAPKTREADRFWPVLRDLIEARTVFGLRRPVLATLRALISFLEEGSVVFASNRSIATRAEGISESALRRHIKALVDLGLVTRRDSSNGKRYRLEAEGRENLVFGLDLAPLEAARDRIAEAAERCREENRMVRYLRKQLGQLIYLARSLGRADDEIQPYQNALRQKLSSRTYAGLCDALSPLPELIETCETTAVASSQDHRPESAFTSKMTGRDIQNDCHKNITEERLLNTVELETPQSRTAGQKPLARRTDDWPQQNCEDRDQEDLDHQDPAAHSGDDPELHSKALLQAEPALLRKAKALAPDALAFAEETPQSWQEVETLAWRLASWSGISPRLLSAAIDTAGQRMTAMAVLTVTQNAGRIRNPGAYFRTLTMGRHFPRFARPLAHLN